MLNIRKKFTLLELSVVLLVIVITASFAASIGVPIVEQTIEKQYERNVRATVTAIVGDSSIRDFDGSVLRHGYLNDMGSLPGSIDELWIEPADSSKLYSKRSFTINGIDGHLYGGWKGPYYESINDNLRDNLRLESDDYNDVADDDDDLRLYASGYSASTENFIYGEDSFRVRTVTVSGIPPEFTAKLTIYYIQNGALTGPVEQNITGSGDTIELPIGISAFHALFLEGQVDHTVVTTQADPVPSPANIGDKVRVSSTATGAFVGKENNIVTWNGSSYDDPATVPLAKETLYDEAEDKYFQFINGEWEEQNVKGKETPLIIKTLKNDILLELE